MKSTKTLALLLIFAVIITTLSGCNNAEKPLKGDTTTAGDKKRTDLIIGQPSDVVNPDPHEQNDSNSNRVIRMMYNSLLYQSPQGEILPALAETWEQASDTEYIFHLRQNVKFHNGYDFTSEDVVFSLERQKKSPKVKTFLESVSEVKAIDEYTVSIKTSKPYAPLLYNLSLTQSSIISKKHYNEAVSQGKSYSDLPLGTGPMKFKSWTPNDTFIVERYDEYWGEKAVATSIEMRVIPEASSRTIALETGEIDMVDTVPSVDIPRIEKNKNLKTVKQPSPSVTYVSFNTKKAPFDNPDVRKALSYAVDKAAIIDVICEGYAIPINTIYPSTMPSYDSSLNLYPFDLEKSKELMAKAGYPQGFNIEIATSGDERNRIAQLLQSDYSKIGVNLDIVLLEWGAYLDYIGGKNHQMYIVGWGSGTEPDSSTTPLFHTDSQGPTGNRSWYSNPQVDALIEKGRTTMKWEEREPIYKEIQKKVMEDAVWIPLFAKETVIAMNKDLEGIEISPIDSHIYVYGYISK